MRAKTLIFFTVVGFLAGLMIYQQYQGPGPTLEGAPAPSFELRDAHGQPVRIEDYRGKLVFLNFWATWCAPCEDEIPDMMALRAMFRDRPFEMLAISVDTEWGAVEGFFRKHSFELPTALDPGRQVASRYRATGFPETFFIDGNGVVLQKFIGPKAWTDPQMIAEIESLVRTEEQRQFGINTRALSQTP